MKKKNDAGNKNYFIFEQFECIFGTRSVSEAWVFRIFMWKKRLLKKDSSLWHSTSTLYGRHSICTALRIEGLEGGTWKEQYPAEWFPGWPAAVQMPPSSSLDFSWVPVISQQTLKIKNPFTEHGDGRFCTVDKDSKK
jgi:hypothetical protein